ncbi:hypothetical protein Q7O_001808 [Pectobacterium carotovorum subsp. carotovorum PCCS1]|nr:hypothetical protein [Pectobacterium carotovorum subsp. carotovorum PCCS1]
MLPHSWITASGIWKSTEFRFLKREQKVNEIENSYLFVIY